jgi:glycogen synthase
LRHADAVIALTSGTAKKLVSCYGLSANRIFVIPDAVDVANMRRRIGESELKLFLEKYKIPDGRKIVFIGRLSHQKGVSHLIKAFVELRRLGTDATLILAGDGPYRRRLQKEVIAGGIDDRTVFLGSVHHDDIPLLLASTDVLVVPSIYEEFGSVLLEAMAAGIPIVASRVGGIPFTITHGENGLLVPPKDESQLTNTVRLILRDRHLAERLGRRAAIDAQKYDLSQQAQAVIEDVYIPLLRGETNEA